MEFRLYPVSSVYAGWLVWAWSTPSASCPGGGMGGECARRGHHLFRIMQLPPLPEIPELIRGRRLVVIDGAVNGDAARGRELLAPCASSTPRSTPGTWCRRWRSATCTRPRDPVPGASGHAMIRELPTAAQEAFVAAAGPGSGSALLIAELRQLGGALGRPAPGAGALPQLDAAHALFGVGLAMNPEMAAQVVRSAERLTEAMSPWATGGSYLNFAEEPDTDTRTGYTPHAYRRLAAIKARVDPDDILLANHSIRPAR